MTPHEEMRQVFFDSATELLQKLNDEALYLEANPLDRETVREIRRIVHTIKGDSAVIGFGELSDLAHELEDVLAPEEAARGLAEVVLSAADMFDAMLTAYQAGLTPPNGNPLRSLIRHLAQHPATATSNAASMQPKFAWSDSERSAAEEAIARRVAVFNVAIKFAAGRPMLAAGAERLHKAIKQCGEIVACAPAVAHWAETDCIEAALATSLDEETLSARLFAPGATAHVVVQPWMYAANGPAEPMPAVSSSTRKYEEKLLRVDAAKVDMLLNLVGELVIGKSMLQQVITEFSRRHPKDALRGQFADAVAFQSQTLRALQRAAMSIRMVPVERLFRPMSRLVREVARAEGKRIELRISGGETELDKRLADALGEPLGHIVRNAVGHGIEKPEERRSAGKPESGSVRLHAFHEGNQMVIEVSDDGRGIDGEAVLRRAIERGMVTAEQARHLESDEMTAVIFEPGFSTAEQVTPISGRGVGLDVVKAAVRKLKGSVSVKSMPGKGSTIRIKLPLTLAIMRSMLFRVGNNVYATPLDMVAEIRRVDEGEFTRAANRELLRIGDELVSVVRLQRMHLGSEHSLVLCVSSRATVTNENEARRANQSFVMIVNLGERKFALTVDGLVGEQELVIKPLDEKAIASTLVSGASVLGDGTVALVLNVEEAVRRYAGLEAGSAIVAGPNAGAQIMKAAEARA